MNGPNLNSTAARAAAPARLTAPEPALVWRVIDRGRAVAAFRYRCDASEWLDQCGHPRMEIVEAQE